MMKNSLCFAASVVIILLPAISAAAPIKVFLLGGQSNMLGEGITAELPSPYNQPQTAVKYWSSGTWVNLQGGFGFVPTPYRSLFGPEVTFGYRLHQLFPSDNVYLVKLGVDGSNLAYRWNPSGGDCYNSFMSLVNAAMSNLSNAGLSPTIAGMIWMQGEADASNSTTAAAYNTNLTNLITSLRSDLHTPNMPFVAGRILTWWGSTANNTLVRTAEQTVPGEVGHASWINTDDLGRATLGYSDDPGHYGTQGQIDLGIRFANQLAMIPEPSTLTLAGTALLALAGYLWRKRSSAHTG
jgi:hypothetical protein